jgi:hypothetical protein
MVFTEHVADDARALHVRAVPDVVRLVHGEKHPPVHRFQPVADVGKGASDDYAHRVIEVRAPHFLFEGNGQRFFGELLHPGETKFYHANNDFHSKKGLSRSEFLCLNRPRFGPQKRGGK